MSDSKAVREFAIVDRVDPDGNIGDVELTELYRVTPEDLELTPEEFWAKIAAYFGPSEARPEDS